MSTDARASGTFFHAYDVRGRFPEELSPAVGERLGRAIACSLRGPFLIARDTRAESALFERALLRGLEGAGQWVRALGILPTPAVAFAAQRYRQYALVATPSHNALGYTGLKGFDPRGRIFTREWTRIRRAYRADDGAVPRPDHVPRPRPQRPARVEEVYLRWVTHGLRAPVAVVVDPRGGASARLALAAFRRLRARVHTVDARFSPRFFGRSPEPTPADLAALGQRTRRAGAVLGVTFDGDGDRVLFVDAAGHPVEPEEVALLLYRASDRQGPIVASVDVSRRLEHLAPVRRCRVGTRYVLTAMRRSRARVGVEASSHIYWRGGPESSDGIQVAARLAAVLASNPRALSEVREELGPIFREAGIWEFSDFEAASRAYEALRTSQGPRARPAADGFYFGVGSGTCLVRRSNTQPAVRFTLEAGDAQTVARGRRTVQGWIRTLRKVRPSGRFEWK